MAYTNDSSFCQGTFIENQVVLTVDGLITISNDLRTFQDFDSQIQKTRSLFLIFGLFMLGKGSRTLLLLNSLSWSSPTTEQGSSHCCYRLIENTTA